MSRCILSCLVLALVLVLHAAPVLASCTMSSTTLNGRTIRCTTCCTPGFCNTTCH